MSDRSVLLIEDEPLIRWALAKELSVRGYRVETAGSGEAARNLIARGRFGVAVLSIHLPDENGLNLLPVIRARDPSTQVIVISGDATPENKLRAFSEGAWQFVDKPFEVAEIVNLLASIFGDHPDRRRYRRYCCHLPLRISVVDPMPEEASLDLANLLSTCVDVGPGGMRLATAYRLRLRQRIKIVPLRQEPPCAEFLTGETVAEVVWIDPTADGCTAGLRRLETVNPDCTF